MFEIRDMTAADYDAVMPMVHDFYHSNAVEHEVDTETLERTFRAAVNSDEPLLRGLLLLEDGAPVGFGYVTRYYAAEIGGHCLMFEELFFRESCRGKGYGTQVFQYVLDQYPDCLRIRLEVTQANQAATRLYERWGFRFLSYNQMVLDRT